MCVIAMVVVALNTVIPHGIDQSEDPLGERLPLSLQNLEETQGIPGRWVTVAHSAVQFIPEVLNWIEIRTAGWPLHSTDSRLLQEVIDDSLRSDLLHCRHSQ